MSEAFSNVAMLFLIGLPLATTAIGWVAATATARFAGRAAVGSESRTNGPLPRVAMVLAVITAGVLFILVR